MNTNKILIGAATGLVSALIIDLDAFIKAGGKDFSWTLALARWLKGAITGALAAAGMSAIPTE